MELGYRHEFDQCTISQGRKQVHVLERYMNTREGINRDDDTLPDRLLKQSRDSDPDNKTVPLDKMLPKYYKHRGYDKDGIPEEKLLKNLGII